MQFQIWDATILQPTPDPPDLDSFWKNHFVIFLPDGGPNQVELVLPMLRWPPKDIWVQNEDSKVVDEARNLSRGQADHIKEESKLFVKVVHEEEDHLSFIRTCYDYARDQDLGNFLRHYSAKYEPGMGVAKLGISSTFLLKEQRGVPKGSLLEVINTILEFNNEIPAYNSSNIFFVRRYVVVYGQIKPHQSIKFSDDNMKRSATVIVIEDKIQVIPRLKWLIRKKVKKRLKINPRAQTQSVDSKLLPHFNSAIMVVAQNFKDPTWVATRFKMDFKNLVNESEWISDRIGFMIFPDSESNQKISLYAIISSVIFRNKKPSRRGRKQKIHFEEKFQEVEKVVDALSLIVGEDFTTIHLIIKASLASFRGLKGEKKYSKAQSYLFQGKAFGLICLA